MINLHQVLTGEPIRLRYIKRFSICPRVHEESVAEHSYYVAFIALMIAEDLKAAGQVIDMGKLLGRALIHDLDEVFSGDFIRMFKHHNPAIRQAIDDASTDLVETFLQTYPAGQCLLTLWKESKAPDIEGRIMAYADFCSVLSYVWQEIHSGNVVMFKQLAELEKFSNSFLKPEYAFLKEYHTSAEGLLAELRRMSCRAS